MLLLHDEDKIGRFLITWIAPLEEAELVVCTLVSDTDIFFCLKPRHHKFFYSI